MGEIPKHCDICGKRLEKNFVDGKTIWGPWAIMCLECHEKFGVGFGTGRGQMYEIRDKAVKIMG